MFALRGRGKIRPPRRVSEVIFFVFILESIRTQFVAAFNGNVKKFTAESFIFLPVLVV